MANHKPIIGLTLGDAAGIGPEIILKTIQDKQIFEIARILIIGDARIFSHLSKKFKISINYPILDKFPENSQSNITLLDMKLFNKIPQFGKIQKECGLAAMQSIKKTIELAAKKHIAAMVTAPINKKILQLAGYSYPGHTELLADLTKSPKYGMVFIGGGIRLILVTIHEPIQRIPKLLSINKVYQSILLANQAAQELGIKKPCIAIAGLNPHAGENGLFGMEEIKIIIPAIRKAKVKINNIIGPISPDTIFYRARNAEFDFIVAMYHDQGLIPIKTLDFYGGVNYTVGLPIIRTSPALGTAYNIAGKGIANPESMKSAIRLAVQLAKNRNL